MIFTAKNLLSRLNHLTLTEDDGKISWIGKDEAWTKVVQEDDGVEFNSDEDSLNDR